MRREVGVERYCTRCRSWGDCSLTGARCPGAPPPTLRMEPRNAHPPTVPLGRVRVVVRRGGGTVRSWHLNPGCGALTQAVRVKDIDFDAPGLDRFEPCKRQGCSADIISAGAA